jgi:RNA polymerase sigma-32 factor
MATARALPKAATLPVMSPDGGLRAYLRDIQKFPVLEADDEYILAKRWVDDGDYEAAHQLVTSHLRLVAKIASGYRGYGLPMSEVIAEGNIGLMQAVKKFDPDKGFRLSTYAMWWIRASIQEFVLRSWSLVKMGTSAAQKKLFFNLKKMKKRLKKVDESQTLTPDEIRTIASELDVSEQDVVDMDLRMSAHDQHLNARISGADGEGAEWGDMLADTRENQEEILGDHEDFMQKRGLMLQAMKTLSERERDIIRDRRLLEEPLTLEEISHRYNISRERVRQIEARAMEKMTQAVLQAHAELTAKTPLLLAPNKAA